MDRGNLYHVTLYTVQPAESMVLIITTAAADLQASFHVCLNMSYLSARVDVRLTVFIPQYM